MRSDDDCALERLWLPESFLTFLEPPTEIRPGRLESAASEAWTHMNN